MLADDTSALVIYHITLNDTLALAAVFSAIARMTEFSLLQEKKYAFLLGGQCVKLDFEVKPFFDPSDWILLALKTRGDTAFLRFLGNGLYCKDSLISLILIACPGISGL